MTDVSADSAALEEMVAQVAEEFLQRLEHGEQPDIEDYARRHPGIAVVIRRVFPGLQEIRQLGGASAGLGAEPLIGLPAAAMAGHEAPAPVRGVLGDFQILREVGRGGMGVVYEAEQISLGRRVALKVLPFAAALDPKQLQRFKNEAQAAAQLHHQNIVPVYGVGCERGVHYYAMQFIEGQTLAATIRELRRENEGINQARLKDASLETQLPLAPIQEATPPAGVLPTERSTKQPGHFRTVARLGVQAAEALEHAHGFAIIHRDIKPANLLVDGRGDLWITDFGLARFHNEAGLTLSGDLLGTLRYMSPEQALARHGLVDHRTDIYSLGATLYELLTLQAACPGEDRQEVLRQIEREDPHSPRRLNPAIPADLETIVLKALAKEPEGRYATAQELADDLRRFLEDRPIRAKRPTLWQRGRKWLRRHQGKVLTAGLSAFLVLAVSTMVIMQQRDSALLNLDRALQAESEARAAEIQARTAEIQARTAETEADLAAARFRRAAGVAGQHFDGLKKIQDAIESTGREKLTNAQVLDLRNEAIACLAAPDARPLDMRGSAGEYDLGGYAFDPRLKYYTYVDSNWHVILRRLSDDKSVNDLPPPALEAARRYWYAHALFSSDGRFLAVIYHVSRSDVHLCVVWDLQTGQPVLQKEVREAIQYGASFHPDSRAVAMHTRDGNITVYGLPEAEEVQRIELKEPALLQFSFDPTGRRLACLNKSKESLQILDLATSKAEFAFPIGPSQCIPAWSPDSRWVATGADDNRVFVYDSVRRRLHSVLEGHEEPVTAVAFSPQGNLLASTGYDNTTRLWDPASGKQWVKMVGGFCRFSPNGRRLAFTNDRTFGIWELAVGRACRTLHHGGAGNQTQRRDPYRTVAWGVAFSGDGRLLASASLDGVRLWDPATAREVNHLGVGRTESVQADPRRGGFVTHGVAGLLYWPLRPDPDQPGRSWHIGPVETLFQPGSTNLARSTWDREGHWLAFTDPAKHGAVLLNMAQPSQPVELPKQGRHDRIHAVALSPDGRWVAASYWQDPGVLVWETAGPKPPRFLHGTRPDNPGRVPAFSPDNQWLVVASLLDYRWWRVGTWEPGPTTVPMRQVTSSYAPLAFTQDGTLLAITRTPFTVQLVDPASGLEFATLTAPDRHVISWLAFNPDGTQLAVAARDQVIQLWDLRLLRRQLAELGLDWDRKPYPLSGDDQSTEPIQVTVLPGELQTGAVIAENHFEAEDLPVLAADGDWRIEAMAWRPSSWSNGRILHCHTPQGGYVELELDCPLPGRHLLDISFARRPNYGIVAVSLDGREIGKSFDGYHEYVSPSGPVAFGAVELSAGRHRLRFTAIDKNSKSTGYSMGIDYLTLRLLR